MPTAPVPEPVSGSSSAPILLHRVPGALALPSADPRALAVETMLRVAQTKYVKKDAHYRDLGLSVPKEAAAATGARKPASPTYVVVHGLRAAMTGLSASLDTDVIANDQRPVAACVEALADKCLFPAFVFLTLYDYNLYQYALKKSVAPKVGSAWEGIRGTFRMNALRENPYFYGDANGGGAPPDCGSPSLTQAQVMEAVLSEVTTALKSLELLHVSHAGANESFFLGTARPCSVDAYAYAGISAFLHADFASVGAPSSAVSDFVLSPIMAKFQRKMREECPLLVRYAERVRVLLFEEYSSSYHLRPAALTEAIEQTAALQAANDLYAKGRTQALLLTGVFSFIYFIVANSAVVAAMLSEMAESLEELADSAGEMRAALEEENATEPQRQPADAPSAKGPRT